MSYGSTGPARQAAPFLRGEVVAMEDVISYVALLTSLVRLTREVVMLVRALRRIDNEKGR